MIIGVDLKRVPPKSRPAVSTSIRLPFSPRKRPAGTPPSTFLFLLIHLSNSPGPWEAPPSGSPGEPSKPALPTEIGCRFTLSVRSFAGAPSRRNGRARRWAVYRLRLRSLSTPDVRLFQSPAAVQRQSRFLHRHGPGTGCRMDGRRAVTNLPRTGAPDAPPPGRPPLDRVRVRGPREPGYRPDSRPLAALRPHSSVVVHPRGSRPRSPGLPRADAVTCVDATRMPRHRAAARWKGRSGTLPGALRSLVRRVAVSGGDGIWGTADGAIHIDPEAGPGRVPSATIRRCWSMARPRVSSTAAASRCSGSPERS